MNQALATRTLKQHEKSGPFTEEYLSDCKRVWDLLCSVLSETDANTVIKPYKDKTDGHGAYLVPNNRYVPDPEWQAMSKDERDKVIVARKAARQACKAGGGSSGGGKGKGKKGGARKSRQTKWMKKEVKRKVVTMMTTTMKRRYQ